MRMLMIDSEIRDYQRDNYAAIYAISVGFGTYVGSTFHLARRIATHQSLLVAGKHFSVRLQEAWETHEYGDFEVSLLHRSTPFFNGTRQEQEKALRIMEYQAILSQKYIYNSVSEIQKAVSSQVGDKRQFPQTWEALDILSQVEACLATRLPLVKRHREIERDIQLSQRYPKLQSSRASESTLEEKGNIEAAILENFETMFALRKKFQSIPHPYLPDLCFSFDPINA